MNLCESTQFGNNFIGFNKCHSFSSKKEGIDHICGFNRNIMKVSCQNTNWQKAFKIEQKRLQQ